MKQPALNSPCPCGSGKKYKRCCGAPSQARERPARPDADQRQRVGDAVMCLQRGEVARATRLLEQAARHSPDDPGILGLRGMAAYQAGRYQEAVGLIERGIAINPNDSRLHNFLGQARLQLDDGVAAERAFGRAVSLDTAFMEAWCNLGIAQLQQSKPQEAVQSFARAVKLAPQDGEIRLLQVQACYLTGDLTGAEKLLTQAQGVPEWQIGLWLSVVLDALGRGEQAEAHAAAALAAQAAPADRYSLLCEMARTEAQAGRLNQAAAWLLRAIALLPAESEAYVQLAAIRKFGAGDRPLLEKMEQILPACADRQKRKLEFALGKVHSDLADYDRSFAHYRAGNDLARRSLPFDAAAYVAGFDRLIANHSSEWLDTLAAGSGSDLPILIIGTPRSGTTLTEQIISSHSQVAAAGEMDFWGRVAPGLAEDYTAALARRLADDYIDLMRQHSRTARRITDKMPGNFMHLGLIHAVLPHAKIVHCRRHPIDACLSMYFQNFNDTQRYKFDLEGLAVYYEQYARLMAHWRAVLPAGAMFELRYEEMVEDMAGVSRQLMDFLGLAWEGDILNFHQKERAVFTPSNWQVRQPIYQTSKERWRRYEKHLGPLMRLLKYA